MQRIARDPSVFLFTVLAPFVYAISAFVFDSDPAVQGGVNAATAGLAGAIVAWVVRSDGQLAAYTGAAQSILALVLAFGYDLSTPQQAAIMALVSGVAGFVVRDRVEAPVPPAVAPPTVPTAA